MLAGKKVAEEVLGLIYLYHYVNQVTIFVQFRARFVENFPVVYDGFKIKSPASAALQTFTDDSKVQIQSLCVVVIKLGAAAEDVKDHRLDVRFVNITVFQAFLHLFILLLSDHHVFNQVNNISLISTLIHHLFPAAAPFSLALRYKVPLEEFFIGLLFQEKLLNNVGVVINFGEVGQHSQTDKGEEGLETSNISNSLNPGVSLDANILHELVQFN